jgi:hypothetical protein
LQRHSKPALSKKSSAAVSPSAQRSGKKSPAAIFPEHRSRREVSPQVATINAALVTFAAILRRRPTFRRWITPGQRPVAGSALRAGFYLFIFTSIL